MSGSTISNPHVQRIFDSYPPEVLAKLLAIRQLIYEVAATIEGVGELEETLKWGQPSYLTFESKSGSTIRIDQLPGSASGYALYFNCKTTLVDTFKMRYQDLFRYEGTRALHFDTAEALPVEEVKECIALALTYHRDKK